jgi:preprotein translocase subunit SecG
VLIGGIILSAPFVRKNQMNNNSLKKEKQKETIIVIGIFLVIFIVFCAICKDQEKIEQSRNLPDNFWMEQPPSNP